ncbi:transcription factor Ouib-like [Drosophila virilis]|uniref:transcription factor Ouib-like n=1 Tax=Drosophila virilis TaxID=7244 RepID=UPI001396195B|nr:transcription factor Ouib [Drosophila virilis]
MSIQCRTCAAKIFNPNAKNLFEQDDNEILLNIETLTGIRLNEDQHMPKHICTCCHLDLYHSIAFRERCLKTEHYLQSANQKATKSDPLNTAQTEVGSTSETPSQPFAAIKISPSENQILHTADTEALSQNPPQHRILRARKPNCNTRTEKRIKERRKYSYVRNFAKTSPVSNAEHCQEAESFKTSPHSSPSNCEQSPSRAKEESNELKATFDQTEEFHEAGLEGSPAKVSSVAESLPAQDNSIATKKDKPALKPPGDPKVYICDLCGHQSTSPKNLDIHILRHKGEKNFECEECGAKHYSKYLLQLHIRVKHQGEMPFVCRFCDQRFYSGSTRTRHEQVRHIRSWSYECKICGKKYNTKSCLNKHEFLHSGLRPYRCELCNVAFPRKPGLRIHCRTKQHQKRASEALNSQLDGIKDIAVPDGTIVFPDSIIVELDV